MQNFYDEKLTLHQISSIPFFAGLNRDILEKFVRAIKVRKFKKWSYVFTEGEVATEMYFILEGSVKILKKTYNNDYKIITELTAPQFFGEMALIDKGTRSTSVRVENDATIAILGWEALDASFADYHPDLAVHTYKRIAETLSIRLRRSNAVYAYNTPEKSPVR